MKKLYHVICIAGFLVLFLCLFDKVSYVLRYKVHHNDTIGSFYKEEKDSLDVIFVGSSHAYRGLSPMQIWNETGISSYNLSCPSLSIPCSYYLIKEAIRTQHPEVIVLETYGAWYEGDYYSEAMLHQAVDSIPLNRTKIEMITEFFPHTLEKDEMLEFVIPMIPYHSRWDELTVKDFKPKKVYYRGYLSKTGVAPHSEPEYLTETEEVYERTLLYVDKIIELCDDNDVELVFCQMPMAESEEYESMRKRMNTINEQAMEQGVPIVDYEALRKEIKINYETDFYNPTHLNTLGAEKVTAYMGQYLKEHYELQDYREDNNYKEWNKQYKKYKKQIKESKDKIRKKVKKKRNKKTNN